MPDRFEVYLNGKFFRTLDHLHDARDIFNRAACESCLLHGGNEYMHCAIYDREFDRLVKMVRIHSGNDIVMAAYAASCIECLTEYFEMDVTDGLCLTCSTGVPA